MVKVRLLAPVVLGVAALVPAVYAQPKTTAPNVYVNIHVTLTDSRIILDRHTGPRGADARFIIRNIGTKPHTFTLGTAKPGTGGQRGFSTTLKPGGKDILILFLDYRGPVPYFDGLPADRSKPGMKGIFTIGPCLPGDSIDGC